MVCDFDKVHKCTTEANLYRNEIPSFVGDPFQLIKPLFSQIKSTFCPACSRSFRYKIQQFVRVPEFDSTFRRHYGTALAATVTQNVTFAKWVTAEYGTVLESAK